MYLYIFYDGTRLPDLLRTHRRDPLQTDLLRSQGRSKRQQARTLQPLLGLLRCPRTPAMLVDLPLIVTKYRIPSQPLKLVLLIFHLWLYAEDYQGALLLSQLAKKKAAQFGLDKYVKQVYIVV